MNKTNSIFSLFILLILLFSICCKSSQQINVKAQVNEKLIQNNSNQNSNLTDNKSQDEIKITNNNVNQE